MSDSATPLLTILGNKPEISPLLQRMEQLRDGLVPLEESACVLRFQVVDYDRLLKSTISLCPLCLQHVEALVFTLGGRVWIRKNCPDHGFTQAIMENDERFYFLSNKDCWGRRYANDRVVNFPANGGGCCGETDSCNSNAASTDLVHPFTEQLNNKTCTVLVEVTNACNLSCRVCYSDARGDRVMSLNLFQTYITKLMDQKGQLDSVQLTGGEAIMHPQFWEMVDFLYRQDRVRKIYLPTNGILFAKRENAEKLVPYRDKMMVLLQFDGQSEKANQNLRNANPVRIRETVIQHLSELNVIMQLTMTLTKGVNDSEVGWVIDTAMRHSHIKVVALQPVTYSGRYELHREAVERLTLSDVVKAVVSQAKASLRNEDFVPIPCSHPNCGWLTLFVRRFGLKLNIARHIDLGSVMNEVANRTILTRQELRNMVGSTQPGLLSRLIGSLGRRLVRPTDMFGIAIKPFMDCLNYDQDRVSSCCHHLLNTDGHPVSFCEYNARLRVSDSWEKFPLLNDKPG